MQLRDFEIYHYLREILLERNLTGGYIEGEARQKRNRKEGRRMDGVQDRRAAPVSKVFTILAKNKVQRPGSPSRPDITGNKNQNHRPCIPHPPLA